MGRLTMAEWNGGYQWLCNWLTDYYKTEFSVGHTGGGCMAIDAVFEGGLQVMITDAEDTLSSMPRRREKSEAGIDLGYSVGLYSPADEYCDTRGWATHQHAKTVLDVNALIKMALFDMARHDGAGDSLCECGYTKSEGARSGINVFPGDLDPDCAMLHRTLEARVGLWA